MKHLNTYMYTKEKPILSTVNPVYPDVAVNKCPD